jgi:PPOX class probable F420-dependent enzyme
MLEDARVARLGLLDDDGRPRVLPVTFVLAGDALYTAVDRKPKRATGRELARMRFLRRRPEVALTVDRYDDDWERLAWTQVLGRAELLDAARDRRGMSALAEKYAPYKASPPPGPLVRISAERVLWWRAS